MGKVIKYQQETRLLPEPMKDIWIYLPTDYETDTEKRYPVLYMHDGQNMVDASGYSGYSWDVQNTLEKLEQAGTIDGVIVVGIACNQRFRIAEYTYETGPKGEKMILYYEKHPTFIPWGRKYAEFIVEVLKPDIDSFYRTLPDRTHTGTFGSSCGGVISLSMLLDHEDTFGVVGSFSTAFELVKERLFPDYRAKSFLSDTRIYHDMGGRELGWKSQLLVWNAKKFDQLLQEKGLDESRRMYVYDKVGRHTELFWQLRLPTFLRWAFGKKEASQ